MPVSWKFEKLSKQVYEFHSFAREIETGGIVGYRGMVTSKVEQSK